MSIPIIIENTCSNANTRGISREFIDVDSVIHHPGKRLWCSVQPNSGDQEPVSFDTMSDEVVPQIERAVQEKESISKEKLAEIVECLRAISEIASEQNESIAQVFTKAEAT